MGFFRTSFVHYTYMAAAGTSLDGRDIVDLGLVHVIPITQQSHFPVHSHFSHAPFLSFLICHSDLEILLLGPVSPE